MGSGDTGVEDVTFQEIVSERIATALHHEHGRERLLLFAKAVSSALNVEEQSPGSGQLRTDIKRKVREMGPLRSACGFLGGGGAHESEKP